MQLLPCCQMHTLIEILASKQNPFSWKPKLYSVDGFKAEDSMEEVSKENYRHVIITCFSDFVFFEELS